MPDAASDSAPYAPSVFDDVTPTIKYISSSSPALFAIYAARPVSFTMPGEGTSGTSPYILEKLSFPGAHSSPFGSSSFWLNKRRAAAAAVPLSPEEAAGTVPPPFSLASVTHPESAIRHASIRLIKHNAFFTVVSPFKRSVTGYIPAFSGWRANTVSVYFFIPRKCAQSALKSSYTFKWAWNVLPVIRSIAGDSKQT